jgi:hypothetical protein
MKNIKTVNTQTNTHMEVSLFQPTYVADGTEQEITQNQLQCDMGDNSSTNILSQDFTALIY